LFWSWNRAALFILEIIFVKIVFFNDQPDPLFFGGCTVLFSFTRDDFSCNFLRGGWILFILEANKIGSYEKAQLHFCNIFPVRIPVPGAARADGSEGLRGLG
jgi:hypothetical protein